MPIKLLCHKITTLLAGRHSCDVYLVNQKAEAFTTRPNNVWALQSNNQHTYFSRGDILICRNGIRVCSGQSGHDACMNHFQAARDDIIAAIQPFQAKHQRWLEENAEWEPPIPIRISYPVRIARAEIYTTSATAAQLDSGNVHFIRGQLTCQAPKDGQFLLNRKGQLWRMDNGKPTRSTFELTHFPPPVEKALLS